MDAFTFIVLQAKSTDSAEWLAYWSSRYWESDNDSLVYAQLTESSNSSFVAEDFEKMGRWKDNAWSAGRWKCGVASVAYEVWMRAAERLPECPAETEVDSFLVAWREEKFLSHYKMELPQQKRFGLSRATTLLHFLSHGKYPIYDSRVRAAVRRLTGNKPKDSVDGYLSFRAMFESLAHSCGITDDPRKLDKALFALGAEAETWSRTA